jgi:threonyl-tRNA synthetase
LFFVHFTLIHKKKLGDIETWNTAEEILKETLKKRGLQYTLNPGDGAFYGPKIDFILFDALKR